MDASFGEAAFVVRLITVVLGSGAHVGFEFSNQLTQDGHTRSGFGTLVTCLGISTHRLGYKRYIAICTNEVEIIESTQRHHLRFCNVPVAARKTGVNFLAFNRHCLALFQHKVTIVDTRVETGPVKDSFGGLQHGTLQVGDGGLAHVVQLEVVGPYLAPHQYSACLA